MVIKENLRYHIGDWVVHYFHGVGKIEGIVKKGLPGQEKTYYRVSTKNMDYWIPVEDEMSDHIEPIRSQEDFDKALLVLADPPEPIGQHHKTRKKRIHERWLDGNLNARARLLRDLNGRRRLESLSFNEREMLDKVMKYFINEWLVTDKSLSRADANSKISSALQKSITKAHAVED